MDSHEPVQDPGTRPGISFLRGLALSEPGTTAPGHRKCHRQQDSDIDDRERAIADRYGYSKEFSNKEWTKKSTIN
jgi:hypothetical protein